MKPGTICGNGTCANIQPCDDHPRRKPFERATPYPSGRAAQAQRQRVLRRDGYRCRLKLMGCTITAEVVDHRVNRAFGGDDVDANLQAACKACNERKRRDEANIGRISKQTVR